MFNVNGLNAILIQNNREESEYYDDQVKKELEIKVCPYNTDQLVRFGIDTVNEGTGYFIIRSDVDALQGDQLIFNGITYSILEVKDDWLWNKVANKILVVK